MVLLGPARPGGAGASVGSPDRRTIELVGLVAVALVALGWSAGLPLAGMILMPSMALAASLVLTALARAKIGGQTGDVIGACQQVAEIAALLGLVATVPR
jgi:adenosylcobinamide-GDP ribazoletransferase